MPWRIVSQQLFHKQEQGEEEVEEEGEEVEENVMLHYASSHSNSSPDGLASLWVFCCIFLLDEIAPASSFLLKSDIWLWVRKPKTKSKWFNRNGNPDRNRTSTFEKWNRNFKVKWKANQQAKSNSFKFLPNRNRSWNSKLANGQSKIFLKCQIRKMLLNTSIQITSTFFFQNILNGSNVISLFHGTFGTSWRPTRTRHLFPLLWLEAPARGVALRKRFSFDPFSPALAGGQPEPGSARHLSLPPSLPGKL